MSQQCKAVHPKLDVRCQLDADHIEPRGFDMGQWTDNSSKSPGDLHKFVITWADATVKDGYFEGGKVWPARATDEGEPLPFVRPPKTAAVETGPGYLSPGTQRIGDEAESGDAALPAFDPLSAAPQCTCAHTDPSMWTYYGSASEPGSTLEPDYDCQRHFGMVKRDETGETT